MKTAFLTTISIICMLAVVFASCLALDIVNFACPAGKHVRSVPVYEQTKAPTCTESGSGFEKIYCTTCYHVISSTPVTVDPLGHVMVDGACIVCGEADPATGLELQLNVEATGYLVVGSSGCFGEVVIPEQYKGLDVVGIAPSAFAGKTSVTGVILPDTL